jgi:hypothetical protein
MYVDSAYYKAFYEKNKKHFPWQKGYYSQKIADHAKGSHSHEELVFDYDVIVEYLAFKNTVPSMLPSVLKIAYFAHEDVCFSSSERDKGCRFKLADDIFEHQSRWNIVPTCDDLGKACDMLEFCIEQDGKPYDWAGVSGFKLSFIEENPAKWYCSEVCDRAKQVVGLFPDFYASHPSDSYRTQVFLTKKGITK